MLREAGLYRYEDGERTSETPVDADNHALAALRYLITTIDVGRMSRIRDEPPDENEHRGMDADDERLWRPMEFEGCRRRVMIVPNSTRPFLHNGWEMYGMSISCRIFRACDFLRPHFFACDAQMRRTSSRLVAVKRASWMADSVFSPKT